LSAAYGHVGVVTELLKTGAAVESTDEGNSTPLSLAAEMDHLMTVRQLTKEGAGVDFAETDSRKPPTIAGSEGEE
jgi:ankyrin repeat protein